MRLEFRSDTCSFIASANQDRSAFLAQCHLDRRELAQCVEVNGRQLQTARHARAMVQAGDSYSFIAFPYAFIRFQQDRVKGCDDDRTLRRELDVFAVDLHDRFGNDNTQPGRFGIKRLTSARTISHGCVDRLAVHKNLQLDIFELTSMAFQRSDVGFKRLQLPRAGNAASVELLACSIDLDIDLLYLELECSLALFEGSL